MTASRRRFFVILCGMIALALTCGAIVFIKQKPRANDLIEVNLKEMSNFDMDQQTGVLADIPQRFRDLEGKRITFVGEMWAPVSSNGQTLSSFQAVNSKMHSEFQPPLAQQFWNCVVPPGVNVHYYDSPVRITGILHIKIQKDGNAIKSIYQLDVESVQPADGTPSPLAAK